MAESRVLPAVLAAPPPTGAVLGRASRARENWVLDPVQDLLFIILAPVLSLGIALLAMARFGAERGAAAIITAHIVLTVAHHLPTFIRIYGDEDLFRRYKWSFVLGPLVPLAVVGSLLTFINAKGYPVEYALALYIFLALWDPWHFLRQHFGFTRIYDRNNAAPVRLASNMDWWLCVAWFVHIMASSSAWLPGLLDDLYRQAHVPLLMWVSPAMLAGLSAVTGVLAVVATVAYVAYLAWCRARGYTVSLAKLALLACTFGVMWLTYTPNDLILALAPAWGFKVGFATVGIVHMTQYLAIVWRYDRKLALAQRARRGWFSWLHGRRSTWAVALAGLVYAAICIGYGEVVTTAHDDRLLMSVLVAIGFTSTLMHYYFDGFIWKVRHAQNRQALGLDAAPASGAAPAPSWWASGTTAGPARMLLRQLVYFGAPLGLLAFAAIRVWGADATPYVAYMYQAQHLSEAGRTAEAEDAARNAFMRMQAELPYVQRIAELQPTSAHQAQYAFLVYNEALYRHAVLPSLEGRRPSDGERRSHAERVRIAADALDRALSLGGPVAHAGRDALTREEAARVLASWERQLGR